MITDPLPLQNGFKLQGTMHLNVGQTGGNETDKVQFDFGYSPTVTVPDGGSMLAMLGMAVAGLAGLRRKLGV